MKRKRVPKWPPGSKEPTRIFVLKSWLADNLQKSVVVEIAGLTKIKRLVAAIRPTKWVGCVHSSPQAPAYLVDIFAKERTLASVRVSGKYALINGEWYLVSNKQAESLFEELCRGEPVCSSNMAKELRRVLDQAR